jgi:hypothetical protein
MTNRKLIAALMAGALWVSPVLATQLTLECETATLPHMYAAVSLDTDAQIVRVLDKLPSLDNITPEMFRSYRLTKVTTAPKEVIDRFGNTGYSEAFWTASWVSDTGYADVVALSPYVYRTSNGGYYLCTTE